MSSNNVVVSKSDANLPASISTLANLSQAASATGGDIGTGDAFGSFTKLGHWEFGQEKIETEEDSRWAINPMSLQHGYIHWPDEGRPTEVMVPATHPLPSAEDLPEVDGDWGKNASFQARCQSGEDEGQQVIWKGGSIGFRKAWANIASAIANRAVEGSEEVVPVVEFGADSYQHKQYGKIMTPVIKVVDWLTLEGMEVDDKAAEETADESEGAPARRRRRTRK